MSCDWAQLKERRDKAHAGVKAASSTPAISSAPSAPAMTSSAEAESPPLQAPMTDSPSLKPVTTTPTNPEEPSTNKRSTMSYTDLPSTLSIQDLPNRGRGVVSTTDITVGTTLLNTKPFLSLLDNANLRLRCSTCHVNEMEMNVKQALLQCSGCRVVRYCSKVCQKSDWKDHKPECDAMKRWKVQGTERSTASKSSEFPDTRIRALARVLWKFDKEGKVAQDEFASLYAGDYLKHEMTEENGSWLMSLNEYVTPAKLREYIPSVEAWKKICAQYDLNSFALTTPYLDTVGVSISPLVALFNHSCQANAVIVFPSIPSPSRNPAYMRVVAIRPIKEGEEVVTSYVDPLLTRGRRRKELRERYGFECCCAVCEEVGVDKRERVFCKNGAKGCEGEIKLLGQSGCSRHAALHRQVDLPLSLRPDSTQTDLDPTYYCATCHPHPSSTLASQIEPLLTRVETYLLSPSFGQATDSIPLLELLTHLTKHLKPTSYPLPSLLQALLTSLLDRTMFIEALGVANQLLVSLDEIHGFDHPHPTKSVVLAAIVKLRVASRDEGDVDKYWLDTQGLYTTWDYAKRAVREVEKSFGQGSRLGEEMRSMEATTQQAVGMHKAFSNVGRGPS
ncbi:BZ3500_MvSof-1268-A1-R1_Chr4-3g07231 [Microbotryum saponariae]|uniref:BZ3500_MvSof-1268-A1-R1_Chr4-3g07231 protein n=1 Tax=Microbotryum saponariae TaxID=289078 RepID=A0A2X0KWJ4_9BASI|nr:BZ3500_MvSof-1268-A1-R1_Chr4-3g07231 [Microbotryum saponariae]SDA06894.1 BZ3501_MvSof-1269-A2-R1_Chr4-2g06940 [Microbotryum saponariae]